MRRHALKRRYGRSLDHAYGVFAHRVLRACGSERVRRFGDHKCFISSIYGDARSPHYPKQREFSDIPSLGEFKTLLLQAHHKGVLSLSRADLVSAMDPTLVHASEIRIPYGDRGQFETTYHFVDAGVR